MKMVKSLFLGSAAGLVAMGGAQAADLPVKAKAVEYVKVCSLYGAGFYYIPGTDTCLKLGGYLRVEMAVNTNSVNLGNISGQGGAKNRYTNAFSARSREQIDIDTRTATEYGVVRTFAQLAGTWSDDSYSSNANTFGTVYSLIPGSNPSLAAPNNANAGQAGLGQIGLYQAFIQFAGFTMGKAFSQFTAPWASYPGNNFDGLVGSASTVTGVNQFTYTAEFGNGVSAAISAQDPTNYFQPGVNNIPISAATGLPTGAAGPFGASAYAGTSVPDLIGMVRVDQAWGLFQAAVAAHNNHVAYYNTTQETSGHPNDLWGYAGQVSLSIKNIPTGPGDTINVSAVYTNAANRYNINEFAAPNAGGAAIYGTTGLPGAYQSVGFGTTVDTVFANNGGSQQRISTWGFNGAYTHNWNPYWNTAIYGAYASINYSGGAKALVCGNGVVGGSFQAFYGAGVISCNPDYNIAQAGIIVRWTPVKNLTFSADFTYQHLDQKMTGTVVVPNGGPVGKPALVYELRDQNNVLALLRAQRTF